MCCIQEPIEESVSTSVGYPRLINFSIDAYRGYCLMSITGYVMMTADLQRDELESPNHKMFLLPLTRRQAYCHPFFLIIQSAIVSLATQCWLAVPGPTCSRSPRQPHSKHECCRALLKQPGPACLCEGVAPWRTYLQLYSKRVRRISIITVLTLCHQIIFLITCLWTIIQSCSYFLAIIIPDYWIK